MYQPNWQWDEMQQIGTDYQNIEEVRQYDARMAEVRNIEEENLKILDILNLQSGQTVLEIGTGTGAFACAAAWSNINVIAVDVSQVMLDYAQERARKAGLETITFQHAGFLTYTHVGDPVDAIVSQLALHHLPDMWKAVALSRMAAWLRPGGRLYLQDVVFQFDTARHESCFERLLHNMPNSSRTNLERHICSEYSTLGWIMEQLLEKAGFCIHSLRMEKGLIAHYVCTRRF